jgi:hypothetical protein
LPWQAPRRVVKVIRVVLCEAALGCLDKSPVASAAGARLAAYIAERQHNHPRQHQVPGGSCRTMVAPQAVKETVLAACRAVLPTAAVPVAVLLVQGGLPLTAGGKVDPGRLPEPDWLATGDVSSSAAS